MVASVGGDHDEGPIATGVTCVSGRVLLPRLAQVGVRGLGGLEEALRLLVRSGLAGDDALVGAAGPGAADAGAAAEPHRRQEPAVQLHQVAFWAAAVVNAEGQGPLTGLRLDIT